MSSSYELLCYTREATGREEANNEDIAYSMHLALRASETAEWKPRLVARASQLRRSLPIRSTRHAQPPMPLRTAR